MLPDWVYLAMTAANAAAAFVIHRAVKRGDVQTIKPKAYAGRHKARHTVYDN